MSKYAQALAQLLPTGYAWPRDPDAVWMRVIDGVAASFEELDAVVEQAASEWLPHATRTRLDEWEEATGLPDPCFGAEQVYAARQARLVARLRGPRGVFDDSSTAAIAAIEAVCTSMGYPATVTYNTRMRVGRDRVGDRMGSNTGVLNVFITAVETPFRVGARAGGRLMVRPNDVVELSCALANYVPARFELGFVFTPA